MNDLTLQNLDVGKINTDVTIDGFVKKTKFDTGAPCAALSAITGAAAALTADTTTNCWIFPDGNYLYVAAEQAQTLAGPIPATTGINIEGDATDDDGREIRSKLSAAKGRLNADYFTVGTSPAFYAKCKFLMEDVSGTDNFRFGFSKDEAFNDDPDDLDEQAVFNVVSGDVKTATILNGGSTVVTDTTNDWADAEAHTMEVRVSAAGAVTFYYDGALQTTAPAFSFDSGENVVIYFWNINTSDAHGYMVIQELEWGLQ